MNLRGPADGADGPLVSVITLTFNRAALLAEAMASVRAQTYRHYEHIVIDDGSSDATAGLLGACTDPRLRYIRHAENAGLARRRAECLAYARGKYVAILDSDDRWVDERKLQRQVSFMEANPRCVLLGTNIRRVRADGTTIAESDYVLDDNAIRKHILGYNLFAHSSVMMRASALARTAGYRPLPLAHDYELYLQLGRQGEFAILPSVTTAYRHHDGQVSKSRELQLVEALGAVRRHRRHYPNFWRGYLRLQGVLWAKRLKRLPGFSPARPK